MCLTRASKTFLKIWRTSARCPRTSAVTRSCSAITVRSIESLQNHDTADFSLIGTFRQHALRISHPSLWRGTQTNTLWDDRVAVPLADLGRQGRRILREKWFER